jgi:thiol-disulfide isomerase/thioredoxin
MVERVLILVVFVAAVVTIWWLMQRRAARTRDVAGLRSIGYRPGVPAILYFTAPDCAPCETLQKPALGRLADRLGSKLQILEVDASVKNRVADAWGVLAVPTTFVIDASGRPRRVNHGPTLEHKLMAQLVEIDGGLESDRDRESAALRRPDLDEGKSHGTLTRLG